VESQWRQVVEWEEVHSVRIVGGPGLPTHRSSAVNNDDVGAPFVLSSGDDVEQTGDLDFQPGLFPTLTHCCLGRVLIRLHEAGGKGPHSLVRTYASAHQEHPPLLFDEYARGDLVLAEDNPVTGRAEAPQTSESPPVLEWASAVRAEVQFR